MDNRTVVVATKGIILHAGRILVVRRAHDAHVDPGAWEFPGGKLEFGETLEEALLREIWEETGLRAEARRLLYASTYMTDPSRQAIILGYMCRLCPEQTPDATLSCEHIDCRWVTRDEATALLGGRILSDIRKNGVFEIMPWEDAAP